MKQHLLSFSRAVALVLCLNTAPIRMTKRHEKNCMCTTTNNDRREEKKEPTELKRIFSCLSVASSFVHLSSQRVQSMPLIQAKPQSTNAFVFAYTTQRIGQS